jgi:hypothetical protein
MLEKRTEQVIFLQGGDEKRQVKRRKEEDFRTRGFGAAG